MASHPHSFSRELVSRLQATTLLDRARRRNAGPPDLPTYDYTDQSDLDRLVTSAVPISFRLGTGASIYTSTLLPALARAHHEAILVTCFWAPSQTLDALRETLGSLAAHRRRILDEGAGSLPTLRIRICLSSRSFLQRLLHTQSRDGYTYPPATWPSKLGLPEEAVLRSARIELRVKSLFFLPVSVMHPKFLVVDRQRAFVPSCNISWEPWLEGCVEFEGDAVAALMAFYARTWESDLDLSVPLPTDDDQLDPNTFNPAISTSALTIIRSSAAHVVFFSHSQKQTDVQPPASEPVDGAEPIPVVILPSSHHVNPRFRFLPWQTHAPPPPTPLNVATLQLLEEACHNIFLQTPNLTCEPVIVALLAALRRGVDVRIVTGDGMMLLEQLVTAGTTTAWCVRSLVKRYNEMRASASEPPDSHSSALPVHCSNGHGPQVQSPEAVNDITHLADLPNAVVGKLQVSYFHSLRDLKEARNGRQRRRMSDLEEALDEAVEEPVCPHIKLTIVDGRHTLLGSGNMDRASWYTSQELGVLFHGEGFAGPVQQAMDRVLEGRLQTICDG